LSLKSFIAKKFENSEDLSVSELFEAFPEASESDVMGAISAVRDVTAKMMGESQVATEQVDKKDEINSTNEVVEENIPDETEKARVIMGEEDIKNLVVSTVDAKAADLESVVRAAVKSEVESLAVNASHVTEDRKSMTNSDLLNAPRVMSRILVNETYHQPFHEMLKCGYAAAQGDYTAKSRAIELSNSFASEYADETAKSLTSDATTGSYTVPVGLYTDIFRDVCYLTPLYSEATSLTVDNLSLKIPLGARQSFSKISSQATTISTSEPSFSQATLSLNSVGSLSYLSNELLDDSTANLLAFLQTSASDALIANLSFNLICGKSSSDVVNGVVFQSGLTGIDAGVAYGSEPTMELLQKLLYGTLAQYRRGGHWEMNSAMWLKILALRTDANLNLVALDPTAKSDGMLLGYPVFLNDFIPDTFAADKSANTGGATSIIAFVGPRGFALGDKGRGLQIDFSNQFAFGSNQTVMRALYRYDIAALSSGAAKYAYNLNPGSLS